jgi:hypothetical protein
VTATSFVIHRSYDLTLSGWMLKLTILGLFLNGLLLLDGLLAGKKSCLSLFFCLVLQRLYSFVVKLVSNFRDL